MTLRPLLLFVATLLPLAGAQENVKEFPPTVLDSDRSVQLHMSAVGGILGQIRCDQDQNIYLQSETESLLRLSADGQTVTRFSVDSVELRESSGQNAYIHDFAVDPGSSSVYAITRLDGTWFLVKFDSQGRYQSKAQLHADNSLRPSLLAVLNGDRFLISGTLASAEPGKRRRPFTAIFDSVGQVVRDLRFKADGKLVDSEPGKDGGSIPAIDTGSVVTLADGNAYLMRRGETPIIYVVSASGQLVRTLRIATPTGYQATTMSAAGSSLLITYQKREEKLVHLLYIMYEPIEGQEVRRYVPGEGVTGGLACYADHEFLFVGTQGGKRVIITARP
jgi:hypothetical protein